MWQFGILDAIDILAVAALMYALYRKMRDTGSLVIFQGIVAVIFIWLLVSQVLQMRLLGAIFDAIASVAMIAIVVLFQSEIRQALMRLGERRQWNSILRFFGQTVMQSEDERHQWVDAMLMACKHMSETRTGALIVIQRTDRLDNIIQTGCHLDAAMSQRLVEQVFYKNTPLHDGAMVVVDGRIVAAACVLPLSHSRRIPTELGLRHRSALGVSEVTDARVVVVSEETGAITMAQAGRFYRELTIPQLQKMLLK